MVNYFKLGCNFDLNLIKEIERLNSINNNKIIEVYGSDAEHYQIAARPRFRLQEISKQELETYVKELLKINVYFNYTMNSPNPYGSKRELYKNVKELKSWIIYLESIGVNRITFANPLMAQIIRSVTKTIKLELSTIGAIESVTQMRFLKEKFDIDKVCMNLSRNRDISFLKTFNTVGESIGVTTEIMVNEFCGNGFMDEEGRSHGSGCFFRNSCYGAHATNESKEEAEMFDTYPMKNCIDSRDNGATWLKTRFILPQFLKNYNSIDISHWKITGRTGTTEYLTKIAEGYITETWKGNLLELWKPLETIYSNQHEFDFKHTINIDTEKLVKSDFIDKWFKNDKFRCAEVDCGYTCKHCDKIWEDIK